MSLRGEITGIRTFDAVFLHVDDIGRKDQWRVSRLLSTFKHDTFNFHERLHAQLARARHLVLHPCIYQSESIWYMPDIYS